MDTVRRYTSRRISTSIYDIGKLSSKRRFLVLSGMAFWGSFCESGERQGHCHWPELLVGSGHPVPAPDREGCGDGARPLASFRGTGGSRGV